MGQVMATISLGAWEASTLRLKDWVWPQVVPGPQCPLDVMHGIEASNTCEGQLGVRCNAKNKEVTSKFEGSIN